MDFLRFLRFLRLFQINNTQGKIGEVKERKGEREKGRVYIYVTILSLSIYKYSGFVILLRFIPW